MMLLPLREDDKVNILELAIPFLLIALLMNFHLRPESLI